MLQKKLLSKKNLLLLILTVFVFSAIFLIMSGDWFRNKTPHITIVPANNFTKTLIVVADYDYEPHSFIGKNGIYYGYDVELIAAIANELGMNLDLRLVPWSEARNLVLNGTADLLLGLEYKPEDLPEFTLSMPLHNDQFVAFGMKDIKKKKELYGTKIAALENSGSYTSFLRYYRMENETSFYSTYGEAFSSVLDGTNDFVICRYSVGRRAIQKLGAYKIKAVGPTLADNYFCIGTQQGNTELMQKVNDVVITLTKNGVIDELGEKWLGHYVNILNMSEFVFANLIVIILVSVTLLLIGISIYAFVNKKLAGAARLQQEHLMRIVEYQQLISEATRGLYESIYEYNVTQNSAIGEATLKHYENLGAKIGITYSDALKLTARKQLKKEFTQGYLDAFLPENVLEAYKQGIRQLSYDCQISVDSKNYYWIRITTRIFFWQSDNSVHMISYRQNIDAEKRREIKLLEDLQHDPMTDLYNKKATRDVIESFLHYPQQVNIVHAFIVIDIDAFKKVNDTLGHAFGDFVINEFAATLKKYLRKTDILGRVGGDEFAIFMKNIPGQSWFEKKIHELIIGLQRDVTLEDKSCKISGSAGIAFYPADGADFETLFKNADIALYQTKKQGKNGFTLFKKQ